MISTSCGYVVTDKLFENYLESLKGRFYKILPLKEEACPTLDICIKSLQIELIGCKNLISLLNNDAQFLSLICTLQYFLDNPFDVKTCKREVMKCITITKKLKGKYFGEGAANEL